MTTSSPAPTAAVNGSTPAASGEPAKTKRFGWDISDRIAGEVTKTECVSPSSARPFDCRSSGYCSQSSSSGL